MYEEEADPNKTEVRRLRGVLFSADGGDGGLFCSGLLLLAVGPVPVTALLEHGAGPDELDDAEPEGDPGDQMLGRFPWTFGGCFLDFGCKVQGLIFGYLYM